MANMLTRIFGSRNQRLLRQYGKIVKKINAMEEGVKALDDAGLRAKTGEFKRRAADGETLEQLLPEAFAVMRESAQSCARHAALRRAAHRRNGPARRQYCGDAYR